MFDSPLDFLSIAVAIVAFFVARKAMTETTSLRRRIEAFETTAKAKIMPPLPAALDLEPTLAPSGFKAESNAPASAEAPLATHVTPPPLPPEAVLPPAVPQATPGLEERLGTRWVVWVGGLTLALGGFFMVRYSIEQGLLGPGVRTMLGGLFALALLASGEWMRRRETVSAITPLPTANIPAILTAAGTAVAFATVYAAYALYGFLVPGTAFVLLGLVALGTLAAALLHGPALAGLGIAGAFVTPVLVSSDQPDYRALYIYLATVTAAAFALARARLWRWLAVTTIVFAILWALPCLDCGPSMVGPHIFHVIAGFVLAALLVVCGFMFGPPGDAGKIEPVSSGSLAAYLLAATAIVLASIHADTAMIGFGLLIAGTVFVAWRAEAATGAVAAAAIVVGIVFLEWAVRANSDMLVLPGGPLPGIAPSIADGSVSLHLISAAIFAGGFGAAGFLAQGRSISAAVPVVWAAAGVFTPLALLISLYARIAHLDRSVPFAIMAVILAAIFGAATEALTRRASRPGGAIAAALFATGTLAALALAFTFSLEKGWLTIALALMSMGTAWISMQRPIPFLRWLAAILAAIVIARVGYDPRIAGDAVGTTPIVNWLLWGYGIPAVSFWIGSHFMRRRGDDAPLRMVEAAAILFTVMLAFLEIRHAVNSGDIHRISADLAEIGLQISVALALAIGLERLRLRSGSIVHNVGAVLLTVFAGLAVLFGLFFIANPMLRHMDVGDSFINLLLLCYAIPAVLAWLLSYTVAAHRRTAYANTIAAGALMLALAYISLEIRRLYHGPILTYGGTTDAEQYTYSIAWLLLGVALLGIGVLVNSQRARLASAVVIALTILKAFVVDMSTLAGIYRSLSFICLGLVLVAIGWLYQRILFRRNSPPRESFAPPP